MALERRRVIRESTRKATSTSYKVNLESRKNDEDVHVVITHESIPSLKILSSLIPQGLTKE